MKIRNLIIAGTIAGSVLAAISAGSKNSQTKAQSQDKTDKAISSKKVFQSAPEKPYKASISEWAIKPYTRDQYPKTFATYGSRMNALQAYRVKAANVVSQERSCDEVVMSEISTVRGGLNNMHFFVDCNNGTRFRFSETELDKSTVVAISEADKIISEEAAEKSCESMIASSANYPSTVSIFPFQKSYDTFAQTGAATYKQGFSAKNAFGLELKYVAFCNFQSDGSGEIQIKEQS